MATRIYDLSHTLRPGIAVWPGDTPFRRTISQSIGAGDSTNGSAISLSLHTGTHLDSPGHYLNGGPTVDKLDLALLVGPARLVTVEPRDGLVQPESLKAALAHRPLRLLVKANPATDLSRFPERFAAFSAEAARAIVEAGVRLLGIDAPSVDAFDAGDLPAHRAIGAAGGVILENLRLSEPADGVYQLIALPLKIEGGDGSPVRVALVEI